MPYEIPPLRIMADILAEFDYAVKFLPASASIPMDTLLLHLGDTPEEIHILEMTFVNDLLVYQGIPEDFEDAMVLQFLVRFPFSFDDSTTADLALLLMPLNAIVPCGAFILDEKVGVIFFRYTLYLREREVPETVLREIVESIDSFVSDFAPGIRAVAWREKSRGAVLAGLQADGFSFPPMLPGPGSLLIEDETREQ
jgi:hypothetical protein